MNDPANRSVDGAAEAGEIRARDLAKVYRIYRKPIQRLYDLVLPGPKRYREFWAVRGVNLHVRRGTVAGIIGENGAGKSTLLKLVAGITSPTRGEVHVGGRVTSLIELGAGFHPEFTGRENIGLSCAILGLDQEEIDARTAAIIEFSELGDFIDRPVKTYSSGMYVRLGFSVATCVDPDIMLIDEALSVGDEHFRGKSVRRLNEFRDRGGTTIFVSHDIGTVRTMCSHVILMDRGEVVVQGPAEEVADEYLKRVKARGNERLSTQQREASQYPRWGSGEVTVDEVDLVGPDGPGFVFRTLDRLVVRLRWTAHADCESPVFGVGVYRKDGTYVNGSNHEWRARPVELDRIGAGERGEVEVEFAELPLLAGQYYVTTFLYDHSKAAPTAIDHREHAVAFQVVDTDARQHGMLYMPSRWTVARRSPSGEEIERKESPA